MLLDKLNPHIFPKKKQLHLLLCMTFFDLQKQNAKQSNPTGTVF